MQQRITRRHVLGVIGWCAVSFVAAAVGARASVQAARFYSQLAQPTWAPQSWVFGPVWTLLYAMMAAAAWLVWRRDGFRGARTALGLFLAQLAANALWSWLFFAWHLGGAAFSDIVALWLLIVATLIAFWRHSKPAAALLLPYLLWVSFALALNYSVWHLNPALLG